LFVSRSFSRKEGSTRRKKWKIKAAMQWMKRFSKNCMYISKAAGNDIAMQPETNYPLSVLENTQTKLLLDA
jgi:hypothetical protein